VVWEGWRREVSPYPDPDPSAPPLVSRVPPLQSDDN
jgi:hypothetical protein